MDEHKKYLADRLLSEEQPVTYRLLSRALDVHVNTAKEMLYDFHKYQNGQKADSIYATYLIHGTKSKSKSQTDGEDVEMTSSMPLHDSFSDEVPSSTITLVGQESLKGILDEYQHVTSLHVYSLAPHPLKNLAILSDVSKSLSEYASKRDSTAASEKYGTILNTNVRRRTGKGLSIPPVAAVSQPPKAKAAPAVKPEAATKKVASAIKVKEESAAEASSKESTPAPSSSKPPTLKKTASGSGIMSSFAKAKPPKPKPAPKKEEPDTAMSDDGEADEADIAPVKKPAQDSDSLRQVKKDREEALRKMMEEDDNDDEDEDDEEKDEEQADEEMAEAPEPEPEEPKKEVKEDKEPAEVVSSSGDGRRRGKRRIMKKKRIMDDKGYMVTINEPGWESFSEDEAPPPAKKVAPTPTPSSSNPKSKKPAGKGQQGNIMSFFSKK